MLNSNNINNAYFQKYLCHKIVGLRKSTEAEGKGAWPLFYVPAVSSPVETLQMRRPATRVTVHTISSILAPSKTGVRIHIYYFEVHFKKGSQLASK